jgi:hypothetical protein
MDGILALFRHRLGKQMRMKGRLAVVDPPLRHDGDDIVRIEMNRIGIRGWGVSARPHKLPWARRKEILSRHSGECGFEPRIAAAGRFHERLHECFSHHRRPIRQSCLLVCE